MIKVPGRIVKTWAQPNSWDDFLTIATHRDHETEFQALGCKVLRQDEVRIGEILACVMQSDQYYNQAVARIGVVYGFYGDEILVDFGNFGQSRMTGWVLVWSKLEEAVPHFCAMSGHIPVDTGLLMGWCKECNVTMTFNRKTARYEA